MPAKSVQTRTPLYAPQEERAIPGVTESILRALGAGGQASSAVAVPATYTKGADQMIEEAARGMHGGKFLDADQYLKVRMPSRVAPPAKGGVVDMILQEQAVDRAASRSADAASAQRAKDIISGRSPSRARAVRGAAGLTKGNLALTALTGAMGPLSQLAGRAYAESAPNPTAQSAPVLTPGGAMQPEDSIFRDASVRTQGDVEMLLAEMARERARSAAAENIARQEQALEVERYLRQGAPYVAIADDFEPLVVSP